MDAGSAASSTSGSLLTYHRTCGRDVDVIHLIFFHVQELLQRVFKLYPVSCDDIY